MKHIAITAVLLLLLFGSLSHAASPVGEWKTIDDETGKDKSIVELYEDNGKIYGKIAEGKDRLVLGPVYPAQGGPQPGKQFTHAERLGNIIVRTGVQSLDLVIFVFPHGENDDRDLCPFAKALYDPYAVHVRQSQVQNDNVRMKYGCLAQAFLPGGGFSNIVPITFKSCLQHAPYLFFIVNDKNSCAAS